MQRSYKEHSLLRSIQSIMLLPRLKQSRHNKALKRSRNFFHLGGSGKCKLLFSQRTLLPWRDSNRKPRNPRSVWPIHLTTTPLYEPFLPSILKGSLLQFAWIRKGRGMNNVHYLCRGLEVRWLLFDKFPVLGHLLHSPTPHHSFNIHMQIEKMKKYCHWWWHLLNYIHSWWNVLLLPSRKNNNTYLIGNLIFYRYLQLQSMITKTRFSASSGFVLGLYHI